ncbi:hypothetical protein JB92DRAFT_2762269 [Gautieria morchelliformis]|nr:hypothetical protein JB92DRAFT_2762269 [Gautieria morchelliformis]
MIWDEHAVRRTELAVSFSALRRVRPTMPFWHLAAHRVPTLWSLYRGLLRTAQHEHIQWHIRALFHLHKSLTSPSRTRDELAKGYRWLGIFQKASHGDRHSVAIMDRYNRLIRSKREREQWKSIFREELHWIHKMQNRPIMTGALLRPSIFNRPLPRLKPQPIHISRMIWNRRRVRDLRLKKQELWTSWRDDLQRESAFEANLFRTVQANGLWFEKVFENNMDWRAPIDEILNSIIVSYRLDEARARTPYSLDLLDMVKEARREKIRNKTHEKERERRGKILHSTIRRMNKGPPAHVLAKMTPDQRRLDHILRGPGEAGYAGRVKRETGMKLKDDQSWRLEDGTPDAQTGLSRKESAIRRYQERRRQKEWYTP